MAKCPSCKRSFRVMDDEDARDHGCLLCGYGQVCQWCGVSGCQGDCPQYYEQLEEQNGQRYANR